LMVEVQREGQNLGYSTRMGWFSREGPKPLCLFPIQNTVAHWGKGKYGESPVKGSSSVKSEQCENGVGKNAEHLKGWDAEETEVGKRGGQNNSGGIIGYEKNPAVNPENKKGRLEYFQSGWGGGRRLPQSEKAKSSA